MMTMNNKYLFNNKFVFRSPNGPNTNPESCDITEKKEIKTHSELISSHEKEISIGIEASNDLRQKLNK